MAAGSDKPQIINHITESLDFTAHDTKWIPRTAQFIVLGESTRGKGIITINQLNKGAVNRIQTIEKPNPIKCGSFGACPYTQQYLAMGDMAGELSVIDLERANTPVYKVKAHTSVINALDACAGRSINCGAPELATASRDGSIKIWDTRQKDIPVTSITPKPNEPIRDCWSVAIGNSYTNQERYVAGGYDNGDLKIFDLRTMRIVWETNVNNGVCSVQFDRWDIKANKLAVGTLEAGIHILDLRTLHPTLGFAGLRESQTHNQNPNQTLSTVWAIKHSPHNRDLLIASSGLGSLSLYKYHYPKSRVGRDKDDLPYGIPGTLELLQTAYLAEQPISSFDWSPDKQGLCAYTAYDQTVRVGLITKLNQY